MRMKSVCCLLLATLLIGAMLSCTNSSGVGATGTGFVWVATEGDQRVQAFNINQSSGSIGAVGSSQPTGVQPTAMALTPDGTALFIANSSDHSITSYSVNSDGSLGTGSTTDTTTSCTLPPPPCQGAPPPPTCGVLPVSLTIDPSGKFLFVATQGTFDQCDLTGNNSSGGVSAYTISGTNLTLNSSVETQAPTDLTGTGPSAVLASPSGNFLYVANQFSNTIQAFSYDASTGALSPLGTPDTVGSNPSGLAFSRCAGITTGTASCPAADGNNLFVTNSGSNNVSIFTACIQLSTTCSIPNGHLVPVSTSPVAAGNSPVAIFVQPVLNFVYAVNSKGNNVTQYRYSSATGALTTLSPAAVNAGANPVGGGVTSDGTYVVVSNNNGSSMSIYSVGPGGQLAPGPTATVTLAGQPAAILVR